jgi:hypothetical protein
VFDLSLHAIRPVIARPCLGTAKDRTLRVGGRDAGTAVVRPALKSPAGRAAGPGSAVKKAAAEPLVEGHVRGRTPMPQRVDPSPGQETSTSAGRHRPATETPFDTLRRQYEADGSLIVIDTRRERRSAPAKFQTGQRYQPDKPHHAREVLPWRCRDGRADSDYRLTAPDGGAEPTEEAR